MAIYILQVPHQLPPRAWIADDEADALALLSTDYHDFDDLSEAVSHDMSSGYWATSIDELRDAMKHLTHQRFKAEAAIDRIVPSTAI